MKVARTPTVSQLRAFVRDIRDRLGSERSHFIGLRARPEWSGPTSLAIGDDVAATVVACESPLQLARAMVEHADTQGPVVLLTDGVGLPDEAYARLAKRRLFAIDSWAVAKSLFGAQDLDPRLREEGWIAEALIDAAPASGFPRLTTGILDEDTAWRCLLRHRLGMPDARPSVGDLIEWAADGSGAARFADEPDANRDGIARRIAESAGAAGSAVLTVVARGHGADVVPLGLALGVLHHAQAPDRIAREVGRFEGSEIDAGPAFDVGAARAWAAAASDLVRGTLRRGETKAALAWIERAEVLLAEAGVSDLAYLSDVLRHGRVQRLERFAKCLEENVTGAASPGVLAELLEPIRVHALTEENDPLVRGLEMAIRMTAWMRVRAKPDEATSLQDAVQRYATGGGFLDWARRIVGERVEEPVVGNALGRLVAEADAWRERQNERFGGLVATEGGEWRSAGSVLPIERVLSEVVAPLAQDNPLLLLVMDGMGMDVFREILESLSEDAWVEWSPEPGADRRRVLAAFPTITNVCRASLFAGEIAAGGSDRERKAFAAHAELARACKPNHPPRVFHKGDLGPGAEDEDTEYLRRVASKDDQVVAVVLNAVDDHLSAGGQFHHEWTRSTIKRLDRILDAAREADRMIVLTSDHGHVLGRTTEKVGDRELGERYRAGTEARDGEVVVQGGRVKAAGGDSVVLPWSERIRYVSKKHGFHGGAAPPGGRRSPRRAAGLGVRAGRRHGPVPRTPRVVGRAERCACARRSGRREAGRARDAGGEGTGSPVRYPSELAGTLLGLEALQGRSEARRPPRARAGPRSPDSRDARHSGGAGHAQGVGARRRNPGDTVAGYAPRHPVGAQRRRLPGARD